MRLREPKQRSSTSGTSNAESARKMNLSYQSSFPTARLQTTAPRILPIASPIKPANPLVRRWNRSGTTLGWMLLLALFGSFGMIKYGNPWRSADLRNGSSFTTLPATGTETYNMVIEEISKPLAAARSATNLSSQFFWMELDALKYQPCLEFSSTYIRATQSTVRTGIKYLIVVVNGGLNQQRNQIVDAVVISRILGTALLVPVLQVNRIWNDKSEFSDIFDLAHFKKTLKDEVLITSTLPSNYIMSKPVELRDAPLNSRPEWFRSHYINKLIKGKVFLLRSLDSRLSKDLPLDLQRLRCKVAFHALQFAAPIQDLGKRLADRIAKRGPYISLHLRLEKDVWVRTGCSSGLGPFFDQEVEKERIQKPQLITTRNNLTYSERRMAGQCPLNAAEVARLLSALGATERTVIYWAGGEPLGGTRALEPLVNQFPLLYNKDSLALPGELEVLNSKKSMLAAIDFLVCLTSDLFIPSHGGNMGRAIKGSRIYTGRGKNITPDKRLMLQVLDNTTLSLEEADQSIAELHTKPSNQFQISAHKNDVLADPKLHCMCQ